MKNDVKQIFDIMNAKEHKETNPKCVYRVPMYQRGYRWGLGQVISLFDDIHRNSIKYADNLKESNTYSTGYEYCIQPLVLKEDEKNDENEKKYIVIDGQQRLTTLSLIFYALNQLECDLNPNNCDNNKKDEITIIYDRAKSDGIFKIPEMCEALSLKEWEISYSYMRTQQSYEEQIKDYKNDINQLINKQNNIDYQFMINNYVYIYLLFKSIVQSEIPCEYLKHQNMEQRPNMDYTAQRITQLRNIFKYEVSVICYEPEKSEDEEGTFEKFNASKIPLTQSELVKALFMNPDNYILAGRKDYSNEAIKVRQVSIGVEWDKIERALNQADLWFFIPHKETHNNSRFDALVDLLVAYTILDDSKCKDEWKKTYEEDYYSFSKLEEWIKNELDKAKSSEEKTSIMERWWRKLTDIYEWYYDIYESMTYQPETEEIKISYEVFHRISLLQLIQEYYFTKITHGNKYKKYIDSIEENHKIYAKLNEVSSNQFKDKLNELIVERVNEIWNTKNPKTCFKNDDEKKIAVTIENKIKSLQYDSNNILMRVFLVIFSLDILEETVGSFSRFSFREFSKKKTNGEEIWVLEHIYAKGTDLSGYSGQDKILEMLKNSSWKEYLEYKYKDILDKESLDNIINVKQKVIDKIEEKCQNKEPMPDIIWATATDYSADFDELPDDIFQSMIVNFLKDNSMGNMSLLQFGDNSGVGNKLFLEKQKKVQEYASEGKFIPIGTFNLFNGVYSDKDFDTELWYPIHRKEYLKTMIAKINHYLGIKSKE